MERPCGHVCVFNFFFTNFPIHNPTCEFFRKMTNFSQEFKSLISQVGHLPFTQHYVLASLICYMFISFLKRHNFLFHDIFYNELANSHCLCCFSYSINYIYTLISIAVFYQGSTIKTLEAATWLIPTAPVFIETKNIEPQQMSEFFFEQKK